MSLMLPIDIRTVGTFESEKNTTQTTTETRVKSSNKSHLGG